MIDIRESRILKYLLFGSLYFTEGLIKVFSAVILPIYFLEKGVPPELITPVLGIAAIPMIIKFVWGGIVDHFIRFGRKRFIFFGGILSIVSLFILASIDPRVALIPFGFFVFLSWSGVGFLDVSSDALAIEISREEERGKINGAMYAGLNSGMTLGAILLPFIAKTLGYSTVFLTAGVIILLIIIFPLLIKEIEIVKKRQKLAPLLMKEFRKKTTLLIAFFVSIVTMNSGLLLFLVPLYLDISFQLDITQIGLITAIFTVAIVFGSLIGGVLTDRFGRKNTLYILIGASVFFSASLIFTNNWQNFTVLYSIIGFLQGGYYAAFLAMLMDVTNPRIGATQFSILTGLGNFGIIAAGTVSGPLYVMLGFSRVFLYSALVFGPALLILYFIRFKKNGGKNG